MLSDVKFVMNNKLELNPNEKIEHILNHMLLQLKSMDQKLTTFSDETNEGDLS